MTKSDSAVPYMLGTDQRQRWMRDYFFAPRGNGFTEPGILALDAPDMAAYNVTKGFYQTNPEVLNLDWVAQRVGIPKDEVARRIQRMYDERLIMYTANSAVQVYGFGLYYWFVKMRDDAPAEAKQSLSNWFQEKDEICTGYRCQGDFDFFNGTHMRVLDNLLYDVIEPWRSNPEVEWVHLAPIRRDIREANVNLWDAPDDAFRECLWAEGQLEKLAGIQDVMDLTDLRIVEALNEKRPVEDYYDFKVLAQLSGLDAKEMREGIKDIVERKRMVHTVFHLDFTKLGITNHLFVVRLFQTTPSFLKAQITDQFARMPEYNYVLELSDSFYDIVLGAWNGITDIDTLRQQLNGLAEVEDISEADVDWQFRRWVCRLDDQNDYWEVSIFTDDFLQNRMENPLVRCPLTQPHDTHEEA